MSIARQSAPAAPLIERREEPTPPVGGPEVFVLPRHSTVARRVWRLLDIVIASALLLIGFVPALAVAAIVKLTSRGPVLFVQDRVGMGGRRFRVYKFRTMRDGTHTAVLSDDDSRRRYEENDFKLAPDDPSITPFGRFLRKSSVDEFPQLINVLRGEMSMVGIRPLLEQELARRPSYDQALYKMMRPGLTGLWQVMGRSSVGKGDRLLLDRRYVETWSVRGDLKILWLTPLAVLRVAEAH